MKQKKNKPGAGRPATLPPVRLPEFMANTSFVEYRGEGIIAYGGNMVCPNLTYTFITIGGKACKACRFHGGEGVSEDGTKLVKCRYEP